MNAITPFIFEDNLIRCHMKDGEPWFHAADVCKVLGLKNVSQAVSRLDKDEVMTLTTNEGQSGPERNYVSEAGVFQLIFASRMPSAKSFKRWLAHDVLPTLRRDGSFTLRKEDGVEDDMGNPFDPATLPAARTRCELVALCLRIHGHEPSRALWRALGLPVPPERIMGGQDEAKDCLWTILCMGVGDQPLYKHLMKAMNGDDQLGVRLRSLGVWPEPDEDGFIIANRHSVIDKVMKDTIWREASWSFTLRRLPGAMPSMPRRYEAAADAPASRGTFLPSRVLDLFAEN